MAIEVAKRKFGNSADSSRSPVALRPHLTMGMPFRVLTAVFGADLPRLTCGDLQLASTSIAG